uniref:RING-type domain-containing protein n=1 Tax=Strongyloides papillosus TaxID=174720 RepID=A0A0N5B9H8_STREA
MTQSSSGTSVQTTTNGFYCKDIGATNTSVKVKDFCKLAHDKEYIFSALALRKEEKFHIRLEVLDNDNNFFVGLTAQDPSNVNFDDLPSDYLLISERMLFTEMFAVDGRKFEMGLQECVFYYNDQGEFVMQNLSRGETLLIGYVAPVDSLWIFFKCSLSFPNLFFIKPSTDSRSSNGQNQENIQDVITRLLPGYFDDPSKRNAAVYNNPNNSPETNQLRLKSFLANKGIHFDRQYSDLTIPLNDSNLPSNINNSQNDNQITPQRKIETPKSSKGTVDSTSCVVCMVESRSWLCYPCGHVCFCDKCCKLFSQNNKSCPICRRKIDGICKVYY